MRAFRDFLPTVPDELTLIALMTAAPGHKPQLHIEACYVGDPAAGEKVLAPLRHHPGIVHDTVQVRPYLELEQMTPAVIPPSYEEHCSGFFADLDEQRIETFAHAFSSAPFPVECFFVHLHGAVTRVPVAATAFPLRRTGILRRLCRLHPDLREAVMGGDYLLAAAVTLGLLGYLVYALIRPERF